MAQINTRLILRNDSTANWASNDQTVLLKGETGIEFLADGKVKVKIGDGTSTWEELSYFGGEESKVFQATLGDNETHQDAITRVVGDADVAVGDSAIVKELISGNKYSHTAYVYDGTNWGAMDGNYSAENVYFDEDFTFTTKIGTVQTLTNGSATVEAAGKSVKDFLAGLFAAESNPSTTQPSITLSASGGTGEVGSSYTLPTATLKLTSVGAYTYGPATGVTVPIGDATITCGSASASNTSAMGLNSTLTLQATDTAHSYTDAAKSYSFSASAKHTDGAIPVTNIGNNYATGQIKETTLTKSATATFTGYRSYFYGVLSTSSIEAPLTSAIIRGMTNGGNYNGSKTFTLNGSATAKRIVVAIPSSSTRNGLSSVILTSAMNTPVTDSYVKTEEAVDVEGANGASSVKYDVYVYEPASIDAGEVHEITLA